MPQWVSSARKTLSFQFRKSKPWSLECPNKLLYVAQWIGRIPSSHRAAYDVMCDTTPACRKPLQFSVSQNVLLLEVLFSPFNLNWNLVVPLEIESQFLSRTCSCISPRLLETELGVTSLTSDIWKWTVSTFLGQQTLLSSLLTEIQLCYARWCM